MKNITVVRLVELSVCMQITYILRKYGINKMQSVIAKKRLQTSRQSETCCNQQCKLRRFQYFIGFLIEVRHTPFTMNPVSNSVL